MIVASVALPMYKSSRIAWLALESLCNQKNAPDWELLVCEEKEEAFGEERLFSYRERLEKAGCKHIEYIVLDKWTPLPQKWALMGRKAAKTSGVFLLQGSDDYSDENRIAKSYEKVVKQENDWFEYEKGLFYSVPDGDTVLYEGGGLTNMSMSFKTEYARTIPHSDQPNKVDGFLMFHVVNCAGRVKKSTERGLCVGAVYTQGGHNNLSQGRAEMFDFPRRPFSATTMTLSQTTIPKDVIERLLQMISPSSPIQKSIKEINKILGQTTRGTNYTNGYCNGLRDCLEVLKKHVPK